VAWVPVDHATSYNIYYASAAGVTPQNYSTLANGHKVNAADTLQSISGLTNGTAIYVVITAAMTGFESDPTGQMTITPQPPFEPPRPGNRQVADTGVDWCADDQQIRRNCPQSGYEAQDGEQGRDAEAALPKTGAGDAGFDFTKLDENGNALPATASDWSCVRDNFSGLTWEVKTRDGGLRDYLHYYTWYDPDSRRNGGNAGLEGQGQCTGSTCDTWHYVQAVNAQGLCGHDDWRLPNRTELVSIINFGRRSPATDPNYFPDMPPANVFSHTWSASTWAGSSGQLGPQAWAVEFNNGFAGPQAKRDFGRVRLVRADP
jgi:hypothetical protein